jgi:hypothetical protein
MTDPRDALAAEILADLRAEEAAPPAPLAAGEWPKDNTPAPFGALVDPFRDALSAAYTLTPKPRRDIPYTGYDAPGHALSVAECLTADALDYEEFDQGRDPARVILACAVRVGIEQGRRIVIEELARSAGPLWAVLHALDDLERLTGKDGQQ